MKPPARRLGRGLGAFLDFGPASEDGAARVADALETTSVLETSETPPPVVPTPPAKVVAAPVPVVVAVPAAAAPVEEGCLFVDEVVTPLSFPEVELE
jgi:hypothetical protein